MSRLHVVTDEEQLHHAWQCWIESEYGEDWRAMDRGLIENEWLMFLSSWPGYRPDLEPM